MSTTIVIQMNDVPTMAVELFAERTGQTVCAVQSQMDRGTLPFTQDRPRATRFVNIAKLTMMCLESNNDKPWLA
ncbi:hypothetical protein FMO003_00330 [Moritella sp. F3]|jgi:hypothetical protein|nr:hypothetical protein FMO001_42010 [Moritella sp. F1]GIC79752.1 hypothetical protein FMO003_00330 [Moritella sp. F3]